MYSLGNIVATGSTFENCSATFSGGAAPRSHPPFHDGQLPSLPSLLLLLLLLLRWGRGGCTDLALAPPSVRMTSAYTL